MKDSLVVEVREDDSFVWPIYSVKLGRILPELFTSHALKNVCATWLYASLPQSLFD